MEAWKIEKMSRIADEGIREAREAVKAGTHVIDMGDDVKAEGITGYMARQIDGESVDGRISAQVSIKSAQRQIYKIGMKGKQLRPEAVAEMNRLTAVWDELELDDPDEDEE